MANDREQRRAHLLARLARNVPDIAIDPRAAAETDGLLRTGEVALLLGVSEPCIRRWSDDGKLPCIRTLGRHRLFPARAVALALQEMQGTAATGGTPSAAGEANGNAADRDGGGTPDPDIADGGGSR